LWHNKDVINPTPETTKRRGPKSWLADQRRLTVNLLQTQYDALEAYCQAQGISQSEGLRRAVALLLAQDSATEK